MKHAAGSASKGGDDGGSRAVGQRSSADPAVVHPLLPVRLGGCPKTVLADGTPAPLDIAYAYEDVAAGELFGRPAEHGLERWAPLLPPLAAPGLGEGNTPLVRLDDGTWIKDESRNPTWSHKDRLNRVTVSAALLSGAPGIVVSSSGNHGASAAAYAARAGLRCAVFSSPDAPPAVASFLRAYGATVLTVAPREAVWPLVRRISDELGYQPVGNFTPDSHTGHPFGPEGYKTIAYEVFLELGEVPSDVYVPTGYGELLFGVWKGFHELELLGLVGRVPRIHSCEPAAGAPLATALRTGRPTAKVPVGESDAYAIDCAVSGYRGVIAVRESGGAAHVLTDDQMAAAQVELAGQGLWCELSSVAGLAAQRSSGQAGADDGPVVCIVTSSGFKDIATASRDTRHPPMPADWETVRAALG
ncbi:pyridoxal-phosphate dependent enzyme [Streptomyces bambusae]|uniref:threonine synthase n=1 Tax=Streptomyces bambusae TaxID=1550616 RepID=UPI001CFDA434|nr:pyridoxal-phosphate dependent enzyme [Streptomyces bambusae]MCB5163765.1 pyridoxal-phosphate dependent enzyme [Streptomyces bambusae]